MDFYRVVLFGHRDFGGHRKAEPELAKILRELCASKGGVEIYIGRNGEFDVFFASVVKRLQKALGEEMLSLTLVLPYGYRDLAYYEKYYDSVIIIEGKGVHPKRAITLKNRFMVEQADLVIGYVEREKGGAYAALKYAEKLNKPLINLAEKKGEE